MDVNVSETEWTLEGQPVPADVRTPPKGGIRLVYLARTSGVGKKGQEEEPKARTGFPVVKRGSGGGAGGKEEAKEARLVVLLKG